MADARWVYALICSDKFLNEAQIVDFLNTLSAHGNIIEWVHVFGRFYVLTSNVTARSLGSTFLEYAKKTQGAQEPSGLYLLTELTDDRNGWLPVVAWNLLNHKSTRPPAQAAPATPALTSSDNALEDEIPF